MQRKLTDDEKESVIQARWYLRKVVGFMGHPVYSGVVLSGLDEVATHGTTDGKPWIEPQPEVGEGYRLATKSDVGRRDLEFWSKTGGGWQHRKSFRGAPLDPDYHYRVPVDRIPTDEDAKQRPTVMVRDSNGQPYRAATLYGACPEKSLPFFTICEAVWTCFRQARFPYPGELD